MNNKTTEGAKRNLTRGLALGMLFAVAACDTTVTNPGPISSEFLDVPAAQAAITNGAGRGLSDALNYIAYTGAAISREVHPSGSTGSFGITPFQQEGQLRFDEVGSHWSQAHRARVLAKEGIARIQGLDAADQDQTILARLNLYAGYISRMMGENMCNSVIDGGAAGSSDVHLNDAIAYFNQAASLGSGDVATAAVAGRASAYAQLGNWSSAVADAATVPAGFSYSQKYYDIGDDNQSNRIHVATKAIPYKAHSQIFTWIAEYNNADADGNGIYDDDPRVPWKVGGEIGDAAAACCGLIAWNPQQKHNNDDSPIELSSYEEMQLLLAEDKLRNGSDMEGAVAIIDALRTAAGVATESPADMAAAWTYYKREHAIEMWLEGRRLPAMRRWNDAGDPETHLQPLEQIGDGSTSTGAHLSTRSFCFPIPESEIDTNPNISG